MRICARRTLWAVAVLFAVTIVVLAVVSAVRGQVHRITRTHPGVIDPTFASLATRIGASIPQPPDQARAPQAQPYVSPCTLNFREVLFTRNEAQKDLDELEWLLVNRYSYRDACGLDYRAALDAIRAGLGANISRGDLAYQLTKLFALLGDGHSRVHDPSPVDLSTRFTPFLVGDSDKGVVAFKPDRSGFLNDETPFLASMDGLPLQRWIEAASFLTAQGSPQFVRSQALRNFRSIDILRAELGIQARDAVCVGLRSEDGARGNELVLPLVDRRPIYGLWPRGESRVLADNVGYLRIPLMDPDPGFVDRLVEAMREMRGTVGLVVDVRGNGGGSRDVLCRLFPYFMAPGDPPRIANVAAYRLGVPNADALLSDRRLYPESWPGWTDTERAAIRHFRETFQPEWQPSQDEFSEWHYFLLSPSPDPGVWHYDKPIVVLMDTVCFSACDIFLGALKGWRNVSLMGTPSGGGSGCPVKYRLHHSLIDITLCSMASFRADGSRYDGRGIQPDVVRLPRATDFLGCTDTALDEAVLLLTSANPTSTAAVAPHSAGPPPRRPR